MTNSKQLLAKNAPWFIAGALVLGLVLGWVIAPSGNTGDNEAVPADSSHAGHHHALSGHDSTWTCAMHPQVRADEPGQCPICGMDLVPAEDGSADDAATDESGQAVKLSAQAAELAGVRTVPVRRKEATRTIRLEGELRHSERLHETQTARVAGRIEELFVRTTGEHVRAGQPLAKMYSPALINAQEELLQAIRLQHEQPAIYRAAREKLLDYGLQPAQIQAIEANGQVRDTLQLLAERGGVVLRKRIREGDHVQAGQALFEFIRHSKVWAVFDLHPQDYPLMQEGAQLTIRVEGLPGETFPARVAYIDHHFRPGKRSLEVRAELTNAWGKAGMRLRPGLFATAELTANLGTQLVVPERAVLWTGKRSVVFVRVADAGEPAYQLRELRLGPRLDGQYAVEKGLQEGEQVVAKGAFTVDAAAQLAGKPSMLERHPANQANKHGQHQH